MDSTQSDPPENEPTPEGVIDGLDGARLYGWAWLPGRDAPALPIEVHVDGKLVATGTANRFRGDLVPAGKGNGQHGFSISLDTPLAPGTELVVTSLCDGKRCNLVRSPWRVPDETSVTPTVNEPDVLPLPMQTAHIKGSLDLCGPTRVRGWARWTDGRREPPELALHEDGREVLRFQADAWRPDIAALLHDDTCCGFDLALPNDLCDGKLHALELVLAESGETVFTRPVHARMAGANRDVAPAAQLPKPLKRRRVRKQVMLSIIVNFYNMRREAERTLTSLTSAYQLDIDELAYEVLCIDNGSDPPLGEAWVESFGPQFRVIHPSSVQPSPCEAINAATLQARGRYLGLMIDGAHLLTPGVLREALAAWHEDPDAVVALRHWFVGGDQRWLAAAGYTRAQEDELFERIHWPKNGYELFRVGAPIGEYPEPWFMSLSESNCLLLPTALYDRVGGFDTAFGEPGGGMANLDLWRRAADAARGALVSIVGEATFHQFHGGTTTNVCDDEKERRVQQYARNYRLRRGHAFEGVHRNRLQFRGHMPCNEATGIRQRPLLPLNLAVTDRVRPGRMYLHFDEGAQQHLQSTFVECARQQEVTWLGKSTRVAASDLVEIQKILHELRPDAVVAAGVHVGLANYVADTLAADGCRSRVMHMTNGEISTHSSCTDMYLDYTRQDAAAAARHWVAGAERVLVLLACPEHSSLALATLQSWSTLVSHRSWLICVGTVFGQPWLGYADQNHIRTIEKFVTADGSQFVADPSRSAQLLSTCTGGYLRKVGGNVNIDDYDPALDQPPAAATGEPA